MRVSAGTILLGLLAATSLASCSNHQDASPRPSASDWTPATATPDDSAAHGRVCDEILRSAPATVAGQQRTSHGVGQGVLTWGDPAIVLRCGVPKPATLDRTSRCDEINGVGWFSEQVRGGYRFTTIGRSVFVEVQVPSSYAPEADALVDLTAAVKRVPVVAPCQ